MKKILIATHGHMASGIKSSIEILTGLQDQIIAVDAYVDDKDFQIEIKKFITQSKDQPCIILTDIIGGSVAQAAEILSKGKENVYIICGVNLPIALSLVMNNQPLSKNLIDQLIAESQMKLMDSVTPRSGFQNYDHEDFFSA